MQDVQTAAVEVFGPSHYFPRELQHMQDEADRLVGLCRVCVEPSARCSDVIAASHAWRTLHPMAVTSRTVREAARPLWNALWVSRGGRDHVTCDCPPGLYCGLRENRRRRWLFAAWTIDQKEQDR